jgi:hypothetical protein
MRPQAGTAAITPQPTFAIFSYSVQLANAHFTKKMVLQLALTMDLECSIKENQPTDDLTTASMISFEAIVHIGSALAGEKINVCRHRKQ